MATKAFHDFDDKTVVADIEAVGSYELLASITGQNGINIPLNSLKTWVMTGNVGGGANEYDVKAAVDTLKIAVTNTVLTLNGKTVTAAADRLTANTDLYVNSNKVAQEGTAPTFTDITANQVQAATGQNDRMSFAQDRVKVYVGGSEAVAVTRGGGINSIALSGNLTAGAFDISTSGKVAGGTVEAGSSGLTWLANEGSIKSSANVVTIRNRTSNGCELQLNLAAFNFKSTGIYGNQTLITVESDSGEASPAEIRFVEKNGAINISSNYRGRILSKGDDLEMQHNAATLKLTNVGGLTGKATFGAATDVYIDDARTLNWRYATALQDGLLSAAQAAQIDKIAAIEAANGDLTQELGFQTVSDGTNTRTATAQDRMLNVVSGNGDLTVEVDPNTANAELKITVSADMVKKDTAQTLTNKTLLAATNVIEATKLQTTEISATAPTDNQILKFDSVSGKWQPEDEIAQAGDPIFSKGSLGAPSIAFSGDLGATSGIYHKMTSPYTSPLDGVAIVQNGIRSALFSEAGVTIDNSMLLGKHIWAGANRTTENTSDLVFRIGYSGIRGNTMRKSIIFKCGRRDVAEMTPDRLNLNAGLSLKIRYVVDDEDLSPSDSVVLCSGNCKTVTLPNAQTSTGQLLIVGAGAAAGSATATGGAAASSINIQGYTGDGGATRDPIDGKSDGVKITANETAMLLCDGAKWMRLGGVGSSVGSSAPAKQATFTKLMVNFDATEGFIANPSGNFVYPGVNTTFAKANVFAASTMSLALKDSDTGDASDVTVEKKQFITHMNGNYSGAPTIKEASRFMWFQCRQQTTIDGTGATPYFAFNDLPAGNYSLLVAGGYPSYAQYGVRCIVTEADAITPGANDVPWTPNLADPVGSYLKKEEVRVLGDTGPSVESGKTYQPNLAIGQGLATVSFTVAAKQNVRFFVTQGISNQNVQWANIQAMYLFKTA